MLQKFTFVLLVSLFVCFAGCQESENAIDKNNDIIIRNAAETTLYILIDGSKRGPIKNDDIARTMWDGIPDGFHDLYAYDDPEYTHLHCEAQSTYLKLGRDFRWYLEKEHRYSGDLSGECIP